MSAATGSAGPAAWQALVKRTIDLTVAAGGLLAGGPIIVLAVLVATLDTRRWGLFGQERIGREGRPFRLFKVRTMRDDPGRTGTVTTADDPRVTRIGRLLRRTRIDELPQLYNVLVGHMSLVGPRPDVPGFADRLEGEDRVILSVRPGVTGAATLKYRDEEELLSRCEDPERYNREVIWPDKVAINRAYVRDYSLAGDLRIIWRTITGR